MVTLFYILDPFHYNILGGATELVKVVNDNVEGRESVRAQAELWRDWQAKRLGGSLCIILNSLL